MNRTRQEFEELKNKKLKILKEIQNFLDNGKKIGIGIDNSIEHKLETIKKDTELDKLKIALIGGFSEGKTTIVASWLEKLDKSTMKISSLESSDEIQIYEVEQGIQIIDTPGLFGFKEKLNASTQQIEQYKEITKKYISEAHIILYVMNSINPIRESHKDELNWLFRKLNLLPRTIFVLSKFDEVVDVEEEDEYNEVFLIKKNSILERLEDLIKLSDKEKKELLLVAVSPNPFDMGLNYWLSNSESYKKLSHIQDLQNATYKKIKTYGYQKLIDESLGSIIKDIINRQLSLSENIYNHIIEERKNLQSIYNDTKEKLEKLQPKINYAKKELREFILEYFNDLILQAKNTTLDTFDNYFQRNIGSEGIIISTKIQNEFEQQTEGIIYNLQQITLEYNDKINHFQDTLKTYSKQGIKHVVESGIINNESIIAARDTIVKVVKWIGFDISKSLKFNPWGATKLANNINATLSILGLALEVWDSYDKLKKEAEFNRAKEQVIKILEEQRKEILELINSADFINKFFPSFVEINNRLTDTDNYIKNLDKLLLELQKWEHSADQIIMLNK